MIRTARPGSAGSGGSRTSRATDPGPGRGPFASGAGLSLGAMPPARALLALLALLLAAEAAAAGLLVQLDPRLGPVPTGALVARLRTVPGLAVELAAPDLAPDQVPPGSLVLAVGEVPLAAGSPARAKARRLGPEGFALASHRAGGAQYLTVHVAPGRGLPRALAYGAWAALEELGFGFFHPLEPLAPAALRVPEPGPARTEEPYWGERGLHLHTMHPTELHELLNGWGPGGPDDEAGFEADLVRLDRLCEWLVAARQNLLQWVLLEHRSWADFAHGPVRRARLARVVARLHAWGLEVGVDAALALSQQNAYRLVSAPGALPDELAQLRGRLDQLLSTGVDVVSTELGFSEFHSPDAARMLAWMDAFTAHLAAAGRRATVKVHVSVAERVKGLKDPDTGEPLNLNFLPHFADPRLGVMVHTVQTFGLDDPAPTYGREDFADLRRFLSLEAGARPVLWYPESAYWVSFDIDVPLGLPLYAERRLHDLRLIARDELEGRLGRGPLAGSRMQGQIVFSSGWEWGYWLGDWVAARAAWDPVPGAADDRAALRTLLEPLARFASPALADWVVRDAEAQRELFIGPGGKAEATELPLDPDPDRDRARGSPIAGHAYVQGVETWDDVNDLVTRLPFGRAIAHQPLRIGPVTVRGRRASREYVKKVRPWFGRAAPRLDALAAEVRGLAPGLPPAARGLGAELADGAEATALRVTQLFGLYDFASRFKAGDPSFKAARLAEARAALDRMAAVVAAREARYRLPAGRLAGWRPTPTAYPFGYLWTVRTLYYWWRDEGKATLVPRSPCWLNFIDPFEVASAEGREGRLAKAAERLVDVLGPLAGWARDCVEAQATEPDPAGAVRPAPARRAASGR